MAYEDLTQDNVPFLILVISEFGRTIKENSGTSNAGTDHGVGGLYIAVGSSVNGGLYNLHHPTWAQPQAPFTTKGQAWTPLATQVVSTQFPDAMTPVTDFRVPFLEIAKNFFGVNLAALPQPMRGEWMGLDISASAEHRKLGFI